MKPSISHEILEREIEVIDDEIARNRHNFVLLDDQIARHPCLRAGGLTHKRLLQTIQREHKLQRRRRRAVRRLKRPLVEVTA